jgi:hypothetical protein
VNFWSRLQGLGRRLGSLVVQESTTTEIPPTGYATLFRDSSSGDLTMRLSNGSTVAAGGGGGGGGGTPATTVVSATSYGQSPVVGVGTDYARVDHSHGSPALGTSAVTACAGNDSRLADARAPTGAASGDLGGTYPSPTVTQARGLRETSGPTTLTIGAMGDGEVAIRSGSTLVTLAAPAAADRQGRVLGYSGTTLAWVAMPLIGVLGRGEIVIEGRGIVDVPTCIAVEVL